MVVLSAHHQRRETNMRDHLTNEPVVEEVPGTLEVPLTGFRLQIRGDTIRMIGFVMRGEGPSATPECTLIIHFPKLSFLWSWAHAAKRIEKEPSGVTTQ